MKEQITMSGQNNNNKKVLEEEEYQAQLEKTIERQFFAHMPVLKSLLHHLRVCESDNNNDNSSSWNRLLQQVDSTLLQQQKSDTSSSLTSFFQTYTSEDNASFSELHKKDLEAHRRKFHWMYESSEVGERAGMLMLYFMNGKRLSVEDREKFDRLLIADKHRDADFDKRVNGVVPHKFRVRNQLMFPPCLADSRNTCRIDSNNNNNNNMITDGKTNNNNNKPSSSALIQYNNTSVIHDLHTLPHPPANLSQLLDLLGLSSHGGVGVGNGVGPSPLERPYSSSRSDRNNNNNNYSEVSMSPSPAVAGTPLVTWGEILGSPLPLPSSSSVSEPYPSFFIAPSSGRERVGRDLLVDKNGKIVRKDNKYNNNNHNNNNNDTFSVGGRTTVSASSSRKRSFSSLTPAAQALANKVRPAGKSVF